jgi:Rrf2 family transcriptional repressor of oqxAB
MHFICMIDVRFSTALQMMLSLALARAEGVPRLSSSSLAVGVASNPTFVRKLLTPLIKAGLVVSAPGRDGGVSLARSSETITLAAIYDASIGSGPLWPSRSDTPHRCVVSSNFDAFFADLAATADHALRRELANQTLADGLADLRRRQEKVKKHAR